MEKQIQKYEETISLVFGDTPEKVIQRATKIARHLKNIIRKCKEPYPLAIKIGQGEHLRFEAWQTLGAATNIFIKPVSYEKIENGWKVKAQAIHFSSQKVISEAVAICSRDEPNWSSKPEFQILSMAQTRACAKALRNCLAWIVVLAGYSPTPAEEIESEMGQGITTEERRRIIADIKKLEKLAGIQHSDAIKNLSLEELKEYRESLTQNIKNQPQPQAENKQVKKGELL